MEVPIDQQTRECLIAQVEAMDKQAKDGEARRVALERLPGITKELMDNLLSALRELEKRGFDCKCDMSTNSPCHSHGYMEMARKTLKELDALAPTPKEKEKPNGR